MAHQHFICKTANEQQYPSACFEKDLPGQLHRFLKTLLPFSKRKEVSLVHRPKLCTLNTLLCKC